MSIRLLSCAREIGGESCYNRDEGGRGTGLLIWLVQGVMDSGYMLYTRLLRPLLFCCDPEWVHGQTVRVCAGAAWVPGLSRVVRAVAEEQAPELTVQAAGLTFPNPVGLAAGWDKSGQAVRFVENLGFGFQEIGSISARPSRGNPTPRLFRLPQDQAIVVNYGLPNDGAEVVATRLQGFCPRIPLGINLVSTNDGPKAPARPQEEIFADYACSARLLHESASYLTLNLSCPNVGGHNLFQQPGNLAALLAQLHPLELTCPVFLKVPPVSDSAQLEQWLTETDPFPWVKGFIFNLPSGKPAGLQLTTPQEKWSGLPGAVAGPPVAELIDLCIAELYRRMDRSRYSIIGAGGIMTAEDAYRKMKLGASLVQIYTALVYRGPGVVRQINQGLLDCLRRDRANSLTEIIGTAD